MRMSRERMSSLDWTTPGKRTTAETRVCPSLGNQKTLRLQPRPQTQTAQSPLRQNANGPAQPPQRPNPNPNPPMIPNFEGRRGPSSLKHHTPSPRPSRSPNYSLHPPPSREWAEQKQRSAKPSAKPATRQHLHPPHANHPSPPHDPNSNSFPSISDQLNDPQPIQPHTTPPSLLKTLHRPRDPDPNRKKAR